MLMIVPMLYYEAARKGADTFSDQRTSVFVHGARSHTLVFGRDLRRGDFALVLPPGAREPRLGNASIQ